MAHVLHKQSRYGQTIWPRARLASYDVMRSHLLRFARCFFFFIVNNLFCEMENFFTIIESYRLFRVRVSTCALGIEGTHTYCTDNWILSFFSFSFTFSVSFFQWPTYIGMYICIWYIPTLLECIQQFLLSCIKNVSKTLDDKMPTRSSTTFQN